jgi:hypothetical protein
MKFASGVEAFAYGVTPIVFPCVSAGGAFLGTPFNGSRFPRVEALADFITPAIPPLVCTNGAGSKRGDWGSQQQCKCKASQHRDLLMPNVVVNGGPARRNTAAQC